MANNDDAIRGEDVPSFPICTLFPNNELLTISLSRDTQLSELSGIANNAQDQIRNFLKDYCPLKNELLKLIGKEENSECDYCRSTVNKPIQTTMAFGTQDIMVPMPMPNSLAISMCRKRLSLDPNVTSVFGFPTSLICLPKLAKQEFSPDPNLARFVTYSYIHRPTRIPGPANNDEAAILGEQGKQLLDTIEDYRPSKRRCYLQNMVKFFDNFLTHFYQKTDRSSEVNPPQVHLTLSTAFRFVVMSEHKNIKDMTNFLLNLERKMPEGKQISTFVTWYDARWTRNDNVTLINKNEFLEDDLDEPITFRLLVKCRGTLWESATGHAGNSKNSTVNGFDAVDNLGINDLFSSKEFEILSLHSGSEEDQTWFPRPYFWDFIIFVRTARVSELLSKLVSWKKNRPDIVDVVTMPLLSTDAEVRASEPVDLTLVQDRFDYMNIFRDKIYLHDLNNTLTDLEGQQKDLAKLTLTKKDDGELDNPGLHITWNNLKHEIAYIQNSIYQLRNNWFHLIHYRGLDSIRTRYPRTFKSMDQSLRKLLEKMSKAEGSNKTIKCNGLLLGVVEEVFWELRNTMGTMRKIAAEFNDKAESLQAVTSAEHVIKVAETGGVVDMVSEAAGRTLWGYLLRPQESKHAGWPNALDPYQSKWDGIVCSTAENDFEIHPNWQILFLPSDIKSLGHEKFMIIAHEAGHNTLNDIDKVKKNEMHNINDAHFTFIRDVWNPLWSELDLLTYHSPSLESLQGEMLKQKKKPLAMFEFMADILALLSAGPAYLNVLLNHGFLREARLSNDNLYREFAPNSQGNNHSPLWLRGLILYQVYRLLGWYDTSLGDVFQIEGTIKERLTPYLEKILQDNLKLGKLAKDELTEKFDDSLVEFFLSNSDFVINEIAVKKEKDAILPDHLLLKHLKSKEGYEWIDRLVRWLNSHDKHFLFYPLDIIEPEPEEFVSFPDLDNLIPYDVFKSKLSEKQDEEESEKDNRLEGNLVQLPTTSGTRAEDGDCLDFDYSFNELIQKAEYNLANLDIGKPEDTNNTLLFSPNIIKVVNKYCKDLGQRMTGSSAQDNEKNMGTLILDAPISYILAGSYYLTPQNLPSYINRFRVIHSIYYSDISDSYIELHDLIRKNI